MVVVVVESAAVVVVIVAVAVVVMVRVCVCSVWCACVVVWGRGWRGYVCAHVCASACYSGMAVFTLGPVKNCSSEDHRPITVNDYYRVWCEGGDTRG